MEDQFEKFENLSTEVAVIKSTLDNHTKVHDDILREMRSGFVEIKTRLDVANGRTKKNEKAIAFAQGGLAVMAIVAVPILAWALYTLVNIHIEISDVVAKELENYEFVISE